METRVTSRFWRRSAVVYLALLHLLVVVLVTKTNFWEKLRTRLGFEEQQSELMDKDESSYELLARLDKMASPGALVFLGDSHLAHLRVNRFGQSALNLALGEDTAHKLSLRLSGYHSLLHARGIVLAIGQNDLFYRSPEEAAAIISEIVASFPPNTPLVLSEVLPVDEKRAPSQKTNTKIQQLNDLLQALCKRTRQCRFASLPERFSAPSTFDSDGVHLSTEGERLWQEALCNTILACEPR